LITNNMGCIARVVSSNLYATDLSMELKRKIEMHIQMGLHCIRCILVDRDLLAVTVMATQCA